MASKPAPGLSAITADDESGLTLDGFLVFADEPKAAARDSLAQLAALGIEVKVATGDNPRVAEKVCADLGLPSKGTITGAEMDTLDDAGFDDAAQNHTIFARISPEQKARLIVSARRSGRSVGFLGDGVNDALALHAADVGISVDTATDVAKDAADVVLLEKDLGVLATGVAEGRRIFANTIKYVLMGTSSNFGNMFSAAAASAVLTFLPMLPSQILLNNLLYDSSQLAIPTDSVDAEQLHAPSHWNIAFIRRFMLTFGPISSLFDFLTFGLMLGVLHAGPVEFRTGWFVESLATQTLIIFAIRTRRVPFFRSRPGVVLTLADLRRDRRGRRAHRVTAGPQTRVHHTAVAVLHRAGPVDGRLPGTRRGDQDGVLRRSDAPGRTATSHPRARRTASTAEPPGSATAAARPPAGRARPVTNVGQGRCCGCHLRRIQSAHRYRRATGASPIAHRWTAQESEFSNTLAPVSAHRYCARIGKLSRYRTAGDHQTRDAVQPVSSGVAGSLRLCLRAVAAGRIAGCRRAGSRRPRRGCRCARWRRIRCSARPARRGR